MPDDRRLASASHPVLRDLATDVGRRDRQRAGIRRRFGTPATVPITVATSGRCSGAANNGYQSCDQTRYVSPSPRTTSSELGCKGQSSRGDRFPGSAN